MRIFMPTDSHSRTVRRSSVVHSVMTDDLGKHIQLQSHDLKNTRDLRTLLLEAAYELQAQSDVTDADVCLFNCTLAKKRVNIEVDQFKSIVHPHIANRIRVHDSRTSRQDASSAIDRPPLIGGSIKKPTTSSQEAVVAFLLQRYLQSSQGVDINTIAAETKASLPTIYKVLNTYEHCIAKDPENKTLRLHHFTQNDWHHWIQRTNQLSSVYFIDRSGAPRSGPRLAKELARLKRDDLAIGGLMGAIHHLPALDATSSPQLDILVHGNRRADLSFVSRMDPGLERFEGRPEMAHVVVHFIDRAASLFEYQNDQHWGSLPDCIANMQKAGLNHQVNDALQLINERRKP